MRYSFGECRLDTASREFSRRGEPVHLSPKSFDLLAILVEQRPRVVSKAELMQSLWPDTFVVEGNLPVLVAELRDAIGDRAAAATVIKTHHGIGYSFTAHVRESRSGPERSGRRAIVHLEIDQRRFPLGPGDNEIGRDPDCAVYIDDASVSRKHALIKVTGSTATVVDLRSKNGTRVNAAAAASAIALRDGDELSFGQVRARFVAPRRRNQASTVTL